MKKIFSFGLLFVLTTILVAQPDPSYYNSAVGKSNGELKTALYNIIKVGTRLSYGSGSGATWSGFEKCDLHPDGYVWDMYSNNKVPFPGNGQAAPGMNIEHSVAKSWWGGGKNDAYKDLYHLNPSNSTANSARGSYPLGINNGSSFNNGVIKVGNNTFGTEYTGKCFEPLDEYKGDFARAYLYMFTCYENLSWTGTSAPTMINAGETWPMLKPWAINLLVAWTRQDPVSEKELNRSNAIYLIQNNRNPFIDYPELVEYIWGDRQGQPFSTGDIEYPYLSLPNTGYQLNFGTVPYQQNATETFMVKGHNLEGNLSLSVTGTNASMFHLSTGTIPANDAENGYLLTVTYNASAVGTHTATIHISGGGITARTITVKANSSNNFMALPASNIVSNCFTANWTVSASATGYKIDVFTLEGDEGNEAEEILDEGFAGNQAPSGWTISSVFFKGTDNVDGVVRLASGNNNGSITIPNIDLLNTKSDLTVYAKRYNTTDSNPVLSVTFNGVKITDWLTTNNFVKYTVELPEAPTNASTLVLSAQKGQRIYIDSINISTQGEVLTRKSVQGYPVTLGNVLTHQVNGLKENTTYFYTITPVGNDVAESNQIQVLTTTSTKVEDTWAKNIYYISTPSGISLCNLPEDSKIEVYNLLGNLVFRSKTTSDIPLPQKGLYLVKINANQKQAVVKVLY